MGEPVDLTIDKVQPVVPMSREQFFIEALQAEAYRRKDWIIAAFSVTRPNTKTVNAPTYPYQIVRVGDKDEVYFVDPNNQNELTPIVGSKKNEALFSIEGRITLKPGDLPNVTAEINVPYGNVLINAIVLVWPFKNKIPFQTGRWNNSKVEKEIAARLTDNPPEGTPRDPEKIYVDEYLNYGKAISSLGSLSLLGVPAASPKSLTVDPSVLKRRDELYVQYKDQLHDPAIVAKIQSELAELDKSTFKGDPAESFYIKSKSFDVARMRAFIMVGVETGFGDNNRGVRPILTSLRDGWDLNRMPDMVDNLRSGSYNRGHQTALGGESVKYFYRIFQNTRVIMEDCGTKIGMSWTVTDANYKRFVGLHLAALNTAMVGKDPTPDSTRLTEDKLLSLVNKEIWIRSPMVCKANAPSFCARCVGDALARMPNALHIAASDVGSIFMNSFMKKMHGTALRTARYNFKLSLT